MARAIPSWTAHPGVFGEASVIKIAGKNDSKDKHKGHEECMFVDYSTNSLECHSSNTKAGKGKKCKSGCYKCLQKGHTVSECTNSAHANVKQCSSCGLWGHNPEQC
jgi:hypothetical protein